MRTVTITFLLLFYILNLSANSLSIELLTDRIRKIHEAGENIIVLTENRSLEIYRKNARVFSLKAPRYIDFCISNDTLIIWMVKTTSRVQIIQLSEKVNLQKSIQINKKIDSIIPYNGQYLVFFEKKEFVALNSINDLENIKFFSKTDFPVWRENLILSGNEMFYYFNNQLYKWEDGVFIKHIQIPNGNFFIHNSFIAVGYDDKTVVYELKTKKNINTFPAFNAWNRITFFLISDTSISIAEQNAVTTITENTSQRFTTSNKIVFIENKKIIYDNQTGEYFPDYKNYFIRQCIKSNNTLYFYISKKQYGTFGNGILLPVVIQ